MGIYLETGLYDVFADVVQAWCRDHGIELEVKNRDEHWIFTKNGRVAEWWPSTGRFAPYRQYANKHRVQTWRDMQQTLERVLSEER